jgi:hypothetical protein
MGNFFEEGLLDELFLTLAPQVAGRDGSTERPGLVDGKQFAPEHPLWGTLVDLRRGGSHLFLRYAFARTADSRPFRQDQREEVPGVPTPLPAVPAEATSSS